MVISGSEGFRSLGAEEFLGFERSRVYKFGGRTPRKGEVCP